MINNWFDYELSDIKRGYAADTQSGRYVCLVCGRGFDQGEVFQREGRFYRADRAAELHVQGEHGGMAKVLLQCDKKATGLTDIQKELFTLLLQGLGDGEIAAQTQVAAATVRHTRFTLRERARQAKLYLALFELTDQVFRGRNKGRELVEIHGAATMVDDRYDVTREEEEKILRVSFSSLEPLRLAVFPAREKKKIVVLKRLVSLFDPGKPYTELQVNAMLKPVYEDVATLRRYLIEYGFMERNADGSAYRRTQNNG